MAQVTVFRFDLILLTVGDLLGYSGGFLGGVGVMSLVESSNKNVVVLDNRVVDSVCTFSLVEKRLVYILLSRVKSSYFKAPTQKMLLDKSVTPEDIKNGVLCEGQHLDSTIWYNLSVRDYAEHCGISLDNARTELQTTVENLRTRYVTVDYGNKGWLKVNWVSSIKYDRELDAVGVKWNSDIIPFLCNLTAYFTRIKLKEVLLLRSTYSWKLHEILIMRRGTQDYKNKVEITVTDLKKLLDVPPGLQAYKYFKSKILNPAVKELREKKVREFLEFEEVKAGKWVHKLIWSWEEPKNEIENKS